VAEAILAQGPLYDRPAWSTAYETALRAGDISSGLVLSFETGVSSGTGGGDVDSCGCSCHHGCFAHECYDGFTKLEDTKENTTLSSGGGYRTAEYEASWVLVPSELASS